jgi:hypothetical protein
MAVTLTFHIVYVPGSVAFLLPFVATLLRWSDCRFRLVANGCTAAEVALLHARCAAEPRLELLVIPTNRPLTHHDALNYLQARCQETHFCFMDSDILAIGPFMDTITPQVTAHAGVFTGAPLWMRPGDAVFHPSYDVICGEHDRTAAGLPLGGTFFAIYDNQVLAEFIHTQGLGFEMRGWQQIPGAMQPWLATHDLAGPRHWFDTGKVLNLGLQQQGAALAVLDSPDLHHLGGLSFIAKRNWHDAAKGLRGIWGELYRTVRAGYVGLRRRYYDDPVNRSRKLPFGRRRRIYGPYFAALLAAAADGGTLPPLPPEDDPTVSVRAAAATAAIAALFPAMQMGQPLAREQG